MIKNGQIGVHLRWTRTVGPSTVVSNPSRAFWSTVPDIGSGTNVQISKSVVEVRLLAMCNIEPLDVLPAFDDIRRGGVIRCTSQTRGSRFFSEWRGIDFLQNETVMSNSKAIDSFLKWLSCYNASSYSTYLEHLRGPIIPQFVEDFEVELLHARITLGLENIFAIAR